MPGGPRGYYGGGGGGGLSYFGGLGAQVDLGHRSGDGLVTIDLLQAPVGGVPDPTSWAMMLSGFGVVGWLRRRQLVRGPASAN